MDFTEGNGANEVGGVFYRACWGSEREGYEAGGGVTSWEISMMP